MPPRARRAACEVEGEIASAAATEKLTSAQLLQQAELIRAELARKSFRHFMHFVRTEDVFGEERPVPAWPYITALTADLDAGTDLILLKSRQLYWTWLTAAYDLYVAMIRGRNVLAISHGQKYSKAKIERVKYIYERLPRELKLPLVTDNNEELHFKKAGHLYALPSTEDAGRGFAGALVDMDEAAFHDYAPESYRATRSSVGDGGQFIIGSTANGPSGWFHAQFNAARAGDSEFAHRFYPWSARPDRDAAWYQRERRAFIGFEADFRRENPASPEEAFAAVSGLVYNSFNPQVHVAPARTTFEQCWLRLGGVDWGGSRGNPNAAGVFGVTRDGHVHQYDEYVADGTINIEEMGAFFSRWRNKAPFTTVECDWQNDSGIQTLIRQFGLPARRAIKKREGLDMTDFLLQNNRYTVDPACEQSIYEFSNYRWREALDPNTKERYQTKTPVDHHGESHDYRRYALQRVWKLVMTASPSIANTSGRPFATSAV